MRATLLMQAQRCSPKSKQLHGAGPGQAASARGRRARSQWARSQLAPSGAEAHEERGIADVAHDVQQEVVGRLPLELAIRARVLVQELAPASRSRAAAKATRVGERGDAQEKADEECGAVGLCRMERLV